MSVLLIVVFVACVPVYQLWAWRSQERARAAVVAPLLSHAQQYWFNVPDKSIRVTQIAGHSGSMGLVEVRCWVWARELSLSIFTERVGHGRWRLRGNADITDWNVTAVVSHVPTTTDAYAALKMLEYVGVEDSELSEVIVKEIYGRTCFCYWSPKAGGTYVVPKDEGAVYFLLKNDTHIR